MSMSKQKPEKVETPPEMTKEDDALLDSIWDGLGKKETKPTGNALTVPEAVRVSRVFSHLTRSEEEQE
jgi:hypothetical protein